MRTVKGLSALLHRMGRAFDGLNTMGMATEEFLRTGNPKVTGSENDYALLQDLRDSSAYALGTDWRTTRFGLACFNALLGQWYLGAVPSRLFLSFLPVRLQSR